VLQNLLVLAVDRETEAGQAETGKDKKEAGKMTVTLAVTPEEAARLTVADEKGKLRMALRPSMPTSVEVAANGVSPKDLIGAFVAPEKNSGSAAPQASDPPAKRRPSPGIQVIRGTKVYTTATK
jgi:pilus assembly protein CpaB